jgi:hypothetical protein
MHKGRMAFCLFLIAIGSYAVYSASGWTFKAALFPLTVGIPLIVLVTAQLLLDLFGKAEITRGTAVDLDFATDVPLEIVRHRVLGIFFWIAGFILLVFLLGFPVAVPIFLISYLGMQSRVGWRLSIALTAAAWLFFYGLFQWLLHLPFERGLIQTLLSL